MGRGIFVEFLPERSTVLAGVLTQGYLCHAYRCGLHENRTTSVLFPAVSLAPSTVRGSYKGLSASF